MDARHSSEIRKHLEEQGRILLEAYRTMSHELHNLQVEEEMLMRKLYEHMLAEGLIKKAKSNTSTLLIGLSEGRVNMIWHELTPVTRSLDAGSKFSENKYGLSATGKSCSVSFSLKQGEPPSRKDVD